MKVKHAIEMLKSIGGDEDVVFAIWEQGCFSGAADMDKEEWSAAAEYLDGIDWSRTHDELSWALMMNKEVYDAQ